MKKIKVCVGSSPWCNFGRSWITPFLDLESLHFSMFPGVWLDFHLYLFRCFTLRENEFAWQLDRIGMADKEKMILGIWAIADKDHILAAIWFTKIVHNGVPTYFLGLQFHVYIAFISKSKYIAKVPGAKYMYRQYSVNICNTSSAAMNNFLFH